MSRPFLSHTTISDDSALGGSVIQKSLRFNDGDSAYLARTSSSTSTTFTYSAWIKRCTFTGYQYIFSLGSRGFSFHTTNNTFYLYDGSALNESTAIFRDPSAWYHIVVQINSGVATSYVNNVLVHNAVGSGFTFTTGSNETRIGVYASGDYYFDGYQAEINLVDGSVLAPSSFGYTDFQTKLWRPKKYTGSYGTNGFHLDFSDNSATTAVTLGKDRSGQGNDFTPNNFSVAAGFGNDSVEDTPTNNFCTLTPLDVFGDGVSEEIKNGNLEAKNTSGSYRMTRSTFHFTTGKWYWEVKVLNPGTATLIGVAGKDYVAGSGARRVYNSVNGNKYIGSGSSYGASFTTNDIIGVALDLDNGTITFYKNGVSQGVAFTDMLTAMVDGGWTPVFNGLGNSEGAFNFGQRPFNYTQPTGYKKLNSNNLPPTVPSIINPQKHFKCITYTGDGSSDRDITGLEFKPDFVWIKNRQQPDWHMLQDSVRGANKVLYANESDGESTDNSNGHVNYFNKDGFNVTAGASGNVNQNTETYVAWCWKAGGAAVSNTDGNQTTQVSVNEKAGFSIVTYTGTGSNTNIGHGLGATPNIVITKSRSTSGSWAILDTVGNSSAEYGLFLNDNGGYSSYQGGTYWNDTLPTSTTFRVSSNAATNASGVTYVAYCWTSIPGYSKFGKYTGNGSTDGPFIYTGFRPSWITVKKVNAGSNWITWDSARDSINVAQRVLEFNDASTTDNPYSNNNIDFLSNGFKLRTSFTRSNNTNDTYIYMAFAEQPGTTPYDTQTNAR